MSTDNKREGFDFGADKNLPCINELIKQIYIIMRLMCLFLR